MPKKYVDQNFGLPEYCAYDRGGNLFVDGYSNNGTQLFEFAELPKGGKSFNEIRIQGAQIFAPGGVVWDDPHVLLADSNYKNQSSTVMYELKVTPPNARVVRATHLSNSNGVQQFWKQGTNIIAPEGADFVPVYDTVRGTGRRDYQGCIRCVGCRREPSMRTSRFVIAAAMLGAAACGGGEGQGIDPTVVVSGSAGQLKPLAGASRSWMSPLAQNSSALLYVSDSQNSEVAVFIYRYGTATKLVGRLTGFDPTSECVGPGGDVFITSGANIYQFTHGGTKPIAVLKDDFGYSVGCAVDPVTRNLAVANSYDLNSSPGSVLIYPKASGKPRQYFVSNVENPEYCSYDNSGNLYVDGYDISVNLALGKLPAQSKAFEAISVNGRDHGQSPCSG